MVMQDWWCCFSCDRIESSIWNVVDIGGGDC